MTHAFFSLMSLPLKTHFFLLGSRNENLEIMQIISLDETLFLFLRSELIALKSHTNPICLKMVIPTYFIFWDVLRASFLFNILGTWFFSLEYPGIAIIFCKICMRFYLKFYGKWFIQLLVRASAWLNMWSCPSVCLSLHLFQLA